MADVNGDGLVDVVGFAGNGPYVALSTGSGFTTPAYWLEDMAQNQGWRVSQHPRVLADVDGDGNDDIVGFGKMQPM